MGAGESCLVVGTREGGLLVGIGEGGIPVDGVSIWTGGQVR